MTLANSQPHCCGWELLHFLSLPTSVSKANTAEEAAYAEFSSNSYTPKQVGLFNIFFLDHRDPPSTGPGARLIPWFLPGQGGHPGQEQSKNPSLRASSLSLKNSSTIYLSCLIEDITGELGYVYSILYSSLSTLPLHQAPFPNPPTSFKTINYYVSFSQSNKIIATHPRRFRSVTNVDTIICTLPTLKRTANNSTHLHNRYTIRNISRVLYPRKIRPVYNRETVRTGNSIFRGDNVATKYVIRRSFRRAHIIKKIKTYSNFRTANNLAKTVKSKLILSATTKKGKTNGIFRSAYNLTLDSESRVKLIHNHLRQYKQTEGSTTADRLNRRAKPSQRLAWTIKRIKRIKRCRLFTKRIKRIKRRPFIRMQYDQESESNRSGRLASTASQYKDRDAHLDVIKSCEFKLGYIHYLRKRFQTSRTFRTQQ